MSCDYCYIRGVQKNMPQDMSLEDFTYLVSWAKNKGWSGIRFLGGEPTIHPQFSKMLDICYRNKMWVTFSTNNLFSKEILPKLNSLWLREVSVNCLGRIYDSKNIMIFENNLQELKKRGIFFGLAYVIGLEDENWKQMIQIAKAYRPNYVRISLAISGFSKELSVSSVWDNSKSLFQRTYQIIKALTNEGIPCFVYRPLLKCMLSEEWQSLKYLSPFLFFTRCALGYRNDYDIMPTVNPDLSIFPCPPVFVKGPNIFSFKDRGDISDFYREALKGMLCSPLMDACQTCDAYKKFILTLENPTNITKFFSDDICQGGCLNFRYAMQSVCSSV